MKKVILLGWVLSLFGFVASAYAGFSMNEVADEDVAIDTQKYAKFQATLNKFEPKKTIWVQKEARLTEEDIAAAYIDSIETVEDVSVGRVGPRQLSESIRIFVGIDPIIGLRSTFLYPKTSL